MSLAVCNFVGLHRAALTPQMRVASSGELRTVREIADCAAGVLCSARVVAVAR